MPTTAVHRQVEACRAGNLGGVVARMASGWAVMGARQVLPGYCLLLPDPVVPHLNALLPAARDQFLSDLGRLGEAVQAATGALRINYAIFGNLEPALHAHVHPRYVHEPDAMRTNNPWAYDWSQAASFDLASHGALLESIQQHLHLLGAEHRGITAGSGSLHHLDVAVSDLVRSTSFYDRWLPAMGLRRIEDCAEGPLWRGLRFELGLRQARLGLARRPHDRQATGLHHLAFAAPSRTAVDDLYEQLRAVREVVLDPPADYERHAPGYYAVFFADPDGIKLEYVFTPTFTST